MKHLQNSLLFILLVLSIGHDARAQPAFPTSEQRRVAWLKESWTADEGVWKKLRLAADEELSQSAKPEQLLAKLKDQAQKQPRDAKLQFRWGYAVYSLATKGFVPAERSVQQAISALAAAPSPRSYEFARLRFLLEVKRFPSPKLRGSRREAAKAKSL